MFHTWNCGYLRTRTESSERLIPYAYGTSTLNSVSGTIRAEIKLRTEDFDAACNARGWFTDSERARNIGLPTSIMSRLRNGEGSPSANAIDKVVRALALPYPALFERVEATAEDAA